MPAIHFTHKPLAPEDTVWTAAHEIKQADNDDLKIMCAWMEDKPDDKLTKNSFKLPHHLAAKPNKTVRAAVIAAGNALMGARGGVDIPEGDLAAVKNHLMQHYHEFKMKAPWEAADEKAKNRIKTMLTKSKEFVNGKSTQSGI